MTGEQLWVDPAEDRFDSCGFGYSPISNKIVLFEKDTDFKPDHDMLWTSECIVFIQSGYI